MGARNGRLWASRANGRIVECEMGDQPEKALFSLGQVVATPGAMALGIDFLPYLAMLNIGYWGFIKSRDFSASFSIRRKIFLLTIA